MNPIPPDLKDTGHDLYTLPPFPVTVTDPGPGELGPATVLTPVSKETNEVRSSLPEIPGYQVLRELGRGGMGVVYLARQEKLDRLVAVKMLAGPSAGPEELARFRVEAEAVAQLSHPNIVGVHEVGQVGAVPYFVLDYVEGGSLAQRLAGKPQPIKECAAVVAVLARAMQHAHEHGIVHRDLKPANVLLSSDGIPKITDFGLARRLEKSEHLTRTGNILGTPGYMAPEQASGVTHQIGPAADIYGLGAVLYEMLTGRPPFLGKNAVETILKTLREEPVSPRRLRPEVPRDLETVCLKCLTARPGSRYPNAGSLAEDLQRFLDGKPVLARPTPPWERLAKWAWRRPARAGLIAVMLFLVLAGTPLGVRYWDAYHRTKVEYYRHVIYRWGVLGGVTPLSLADVQRRYSSFKVHRKGGLVLAVDVINGQGEWTTRGSPSARLAQNTQEDDLRECRFEFRRNERGELMEEVALNKLGGVVWILQYTQPDMAYYKDARGLPRPRAGSGAVYVRHVWSAQGYPAEVHYLDSNGQPQPDEEGIFGERRSFDARGQEVEVVYLGADGKPAFRKAGYAIVRAERDEKGERTRTVFLGAAREPVWSADGYSVRLHAHDRVGNSIEESYEGTDGTPVADRDGHASICVRYDEHGNRIAQAYFGLDGQPVLLPNGYHRVAAEYDGRGNRTLARFFDTTGQPALCRGGHSALAWTHDERGLLVEEVSLGPDGHPTPSRDGYVRMTWEHDEAGHVTRERYWGADGQPTLHRLGYSAFSQEWDAWGNVLRMAYHDEAGKPALHRDGYAHVEMKRDPRGNVTEVCYLNKEGRLTPSREGFARYRRQYDEQGRLADETYFAPDGIPTPCASGYVRVSMVYSMGPRREKVIEKISWGRDGLPVRLRTGLVRLVEVTDVRGNVIRHDYLDETGKPTLHRDGYSRVEMDHDHRGNTTVVRYFDPQGRLTSCQQGYARMEKSHDEQGRLVAEAYFAPDGKAVTASTGFARMTRTIVPGAAGQQIITRHFLDVAGRLTKLAGGYCTIREVRDAQGNVVEEFYLGPDGLPVLQADGYAGIAQRHDNRGNVTQVIYLGPDRKPRLRRDGYARLDWELDSQGNVVEQTYCDEAGKLVDHSEYHFARVRSRYDERGNKVEQAIFSADGRPARVADNSSRYTWKYDARGNKLEEWFHGADGKLCAAPSGISGTVWTYDGRGNQICLEYRGLDGKPVRHGRHGYTRAEWSYDELGNRTDAAYFDLKGQPLKPSVLVIGVVPGSKGQQAGFRVGDVIEAWGDEPAGNAFRLQRRWREASKGERPPFTIRRDGRSQLLPVGPEAFEGVNLRDRVLPTAPQG